MVKSTQKYESTHSKRYEITLNRLKKFLLPTDRILSFGSDGQFENLLIQSNSQVEIILSDWDLRFPFSENLGKFDIAICLEVMEHLKDRNDETEDATSYTHSGIFNCLIETNKALKEGGLFVITTPNLSSWKSIVKLVRGQDPYLYWPHVHEFAPYELSYFMQQCGFEVIEFSSFDHYPEDLFLSKLKSRLLHQISLLLKSSKGIFHLRCSTLFIVGRKVSTPREILASTDWWSVSTSDLSKADTKYL